MKHSKQTNENTIVHVSSILVPVVLFASVIRWGLGTRNEGRLGTYFFFDWLFETNNLERTG